MSVRVTVMKTSPETVVEDYGRLLHEAGYSETIKPGRETILNINMPWDLWFPGCSTAPWQLEGVARALIDDGFDIAALRPVESGYANIDPHRGERNNGLTVAARRVGLSIACIEEPPVEWSRYQPRTELPVLNRYCEDGILVPDFYPGSNIIHLPVMKTSAATGIAGAMENGLAAFLWENSGLSLAAAESSDELLVDLLALQLELHEGLFAVSDGVFCADGPGPYYLQPYEKGYIAAGPDPVAVDAVTAHMMGFDPMSIEHIRLAHERGLGSGDINGIEVTVIDEEQGSTAIDFHFHGSKDGACAVCGKACSSMPDSLVRFFRDSIWYPWIGWGRLNRIAETAWGQRFQEYLTDDAVLDRQGKGKSPPLAVTAAVLLGAGALSRLGRHG